MPKRHLSAHQLNKMIEELESHVLYVDDKGEPQYIISPTRKSVADRFRDIINQSTGRVLTYEEAKDRFDVLDENNDYSREQYYQQLSELNESDIRKQLTVRGYLTQSLMMFFTGHHERLKEISVVYDIDFHKLTNEEMSVVIQRAGRDAQRTARNFKELYGEKEGKSLYDSDVFYDYLVQEYSMMMQEKENANL